MARVGRPASSARTGLPATAVRSRRATRSTAQCVHSGASSTARPGLSEERRTSRLASSCCRSPSPPTCPRRRSLTTRPRRARQTTTIVTDRCRRSGDRPPSRRITTSACRIEVTGRGRDSSRIRRSTGRRNCSRHSRRPRGTDRETRSRCGNRFVHPFLCSS